ncbi:MAG: NAD-dependent deacylase [Flavobacteriaceae bacterium]|jgi:NAD-dependent deacetylase|nr:NAD-dependent deacylase [Flavobacteriaceae bacterium]
MKKLVVLTGAGMSAESSISTFRDSDGLWENHDVMEVASIEGWHKNPSLVLDFYNKRRAQLKEVKPNKGHLILAELEKEYNITIVTQNVDNLHEKAGSSDIIHLHGELTKVRGEFSSDESIHWEDDLSIGQKNEKGEQLRPDIVWFGEAVQKIEEAARIVSQADILLIIGTSLQVYPAAGLLHYAKPHVPVYYIDPKPANIYDLANPLEVISKGSSEGMEILKKMLS